eukprot:Rhum_TRINITY_DN14828_c15_g1::Rhum_TRINITY_DN14828_c15_g1_i1::g.124001::m.124001
MCEPLLLGCFFSWGVLASFGSSDLGKHDSLLHAPLELSVEQGQLRSAEGAHGGVLLGAADQVRHDFVHGPVRDVLVHVVAVLSQREGQLVGHAHELAKVHATVLLVNSPLLHGLHSGGDGLLVVRPNEETHVVLRHLVQDDVDALVEVLVGALNCREDGRSVAVLLRDGPLLHHVRTPDELACELPALAVGTLEVVEDAHLRVRQVALVRVVEARPLLVVDALQQGRKVVDRHLHVRLLRVHHHVDVLRLRHLGDLVHTLHHVVQQLALHGVEQRQRTALGQRVHVRVGTVPVLRALEAHAETVQRHLARVRDVVHQSVLVLHRVEHRPRLLVRRRLRADPVQPRPPHLEVDAARRNRARHDAADLLQGACQQRVPVRRLRETLHPRAPHGHEQLRHVLEHLRLAQRRDLDGAEGVALPGGRGVADARDDGLRVRVALGLAVVVVDARGADAGVVAQLRLRLRRRVVLRHVGLRGVVEDGTDAEGPQVAEEGSELLDRLAAAEVVEERALHDDAVCHALAEHLRCSLDQPVCVVHQPRHRAHAEHSDGQRKLGHGLRLEGGLCIVEVDQRLLLRRRGGGGSVGSSGGVAEGRRGGGVGAAQADARLQRLAADSRGDRALHHCCCAGGGVRGLCAFCVVVVVGAVGLCALLFVALAR